MCYCIVLCLLGVAVLVLLLMSWYIAVAPVADLVCNNNIGLVPLMCRTHQLTGSEVLASAGGRRETKGICRPPDLLPFTFLLT
jgi:hypothetical protein